MNRLFARTLVSGALAGAATTLAAALAGRRLAGSSTAPLNATSHFLWGARAGRQNRPSIKYTVTGVATNFAASVFWALFYEGLAGRGRRTPARAAVDATLVSAAAYVTDYHVVPERLTPGWEKRLPGRALAAIYGALALGLCARDFLWNTARSSSFARSSMRTRRLGRFLPARLM